MRQESAAALFDIYRTWQKSLKQLTVSLPYDSPLRAQPFPKNWQVGLAISSQIFELLGRGTFPSSLEADLMSLRQLFVDFDTVQTQRERKTRLVQAQKILSGLRHGGDAVRILQRPKESPVHPFPNTEKPIRSPETSREDLSSLPVRFGKGVGPSRARLLEKLGVRTIEDAFWFIPWRYEDWSEIVPIEHLRPEMKVSVVGRVTSCQLRRTSRKGLVIITISLDDGTGTLDAVFFNQPFLEQIFLPGTSLLLHGEVSTRNKSIGHLHMRAPQHELLQGDEKTSHELGRVAPIYHETKGMTTRQFRRILKSLYDRYSNAIEEIFPQGLLERMQWPSLKDSIAALHFPVKTDSVAVLNQGTTSAHQRLAFEELFLLQLALAMRRRMAKNESEGIAFCADNQLICRFQQLLPFKLTSSQVRVIHEIESDMAGSTSMNRLLQGDVGSGKTMVALHAMVLACGNGFQAALMAPTEVLSEQHFLTVKPYLNQLGLTAVLVKGGQSGQERVKALEQLASGQAQVAVGTHALLQPEVVFKNLGLAVVDEQHKFGVIQRAQLRKKGVDPPDVLVMTATPIPRTLAMTVYGDLDVSVIDTLPPGRKPVQTLLFQAQEQEQAYVLLRNEIEAGRQAYIVYPLVEPSEKMDLQAAVQAAEVLQRDKFPELKVGLLHGRMKSKEKQTIMTAFKEGTIHILVATTVIEVGVDVSNATVILIEHAERFGLAQLHQLRGRVGRGAHQAHCLLVQSAVKPISRESTSSTRLELPFLDAFNDKKDRQDSEAGDSSQLDSHRLRVFTRCTDGFALAEEDLKLRGPGNVLGVQQWGSVGFRVAQLLRDHQLLVQAKQIARECISDDPMLKSEQNQGIKAAMLRKWGKAFELSSVG